MDFKQTGRTSRMMFEAVRQCNAGRAVYVCFSTRHEIEFWESWRSGNYPRTTGIQFDLPSNLDIDWRSMTLRGAHPNCVLFVDHFVIETKFRAIMHMLHWFDPEVVASAWKVRFRTDAEPNPRRFVLTDEKPPEDPEIEVKQLYEVKVPSWPPI